MYKNLKIGVRLGAGFSLMLIFIASLYFFGMRGMHTGSDNLRVIVNDLNVKTELVNTMSENVHIVSRVIRTLALLTDEGEMQVEEKKLEAARAAYDKAWEELNKMTATEQGRATRVKIREASVVAREANNRALKLALLNKNDEARDVIVKESGPLVGKWQAALDENIELQKMNIKKAAEEADAAFSTALTLLNGIAIAAFIFGILLAYSMTRSITVPLTQLQNVISEVEKTGELSKKVDYQSKDEVGQTATAFNAMMGALQLAMRDIGSVMNGMAKGDLAGRVKVEARGDLDALKQSINISLEQLGTVMSSINNNTRQVAGAASQTSTAIGQISDGVQNQMHAISQVATAVKESATSVTDVSNSAEEASRKAKDSVAIVREGKVKMDRMVDVVNNIAQNSEKINKISDAIEKIANKTNLLALNAAIEAARAGEHGKGFAVVAEEVGKLAANSAQSTQEIAELVTQAMSDAKHAVHTVKEVSIDINNIENGSLQIDNMLQRISAAMEQQSAAVQEINANVNNLNQIAQTNAAATEEITATVVELAKIAGDTRSQVERFKV